mmetsp:Transcript_5197/g.13946  ORF Transcript_5197/g.13946 Transcript_5197/m.13946 type:complete len:268 (-) Transcript_5197:1436-2239(-)
MALHVDWFVLHVELLVCFRDRSHVVDTLHRLRLVVDLAELSEVFAPQRLAERCNVAVWKMPVVVLHGVVRLVASHRDFGVARASHRALVDVCRADDDILVIDNHHFRMNVDHAAPRFRQYFGVAPNRGRLVGQRQPAIRRFAVAEAKEHKVVLRVSIRTGLLERFANHTVHHLNGVILPVENFLHRAVSRNTLGMQRNRYVRAEPLMGFDFVNDFLHDFQGDDVERKIVRVFQPRMTAANKVLVLDIDEMLCAPNLVAIGAMDGSFD